MAPRNTAEWDTVDKGAQVGGGNYKLKCKSCGIEFSGSGFRLSAHIAGGQWARRAGVRGCTQPDASLRSKAQETARERDTKKADTLAKVAIRVLAQVASSCSCERLNSEADYIKPLKANRYFQANFERQIHVHHNLNVLDNITKMDYSEVAILWDEVSCLKTGAALLQAVGSITDFSLHHPTIHDA